MHFIEAKTILTPQNGMNLYRGCTNHCIYCEARNRLYKEDHAFTDVSVKQDGCILLENMLKRKRTPCMIQVGMLADPYMDCEGELGYMRDCLKVIERYDCGIVIRTKNANILRDIDILSAIQKKTKCVVVVGLSAADEELSRKLEPEASGVAERIRIMNALEKNRIPCILSISVIPFLNDTEENLMGLLDIAKDTHVYGIEHNDCSIVLKKGSREYFFQELERRFPQKALLFARQLEQQEILSSPDRKKLLDILNAYCREHAIVIDQEILKRYKRTYENKTMGVQLSFSNIL